MIAAGTVEEKMYEKQIYKDGIRRTVFTEGTEIQRYFATHELRQLFALGDPGVCKVMEKVQDLVADWSHHSYVLSHRSVVGLSRHDGFYNPANAQQQHEESEAPTDEPSTGLGRAQRVLVNDDAEAVPLGRKNTTKSRTPPVIEMLYDSSDDENYQIPDSVFTSGKNKTTTIGSGMVNDNNSNKETSHLCRRNSAKVRYAESVAGRSSSDSNVDQRARASELLLGADEMIVIGKP